MLAGIEAARAAGLAVKINAVALKNMNEDEIPSLMQWAHGKGMALTLIEVMPMGEIGEGRIDQYLPLSLLRARLAKQFTLTDIDDDTGGPARYVRVAETGGKLGFITPMTHNFCESCNRVRITCTGTLHTCLGHEDASDLRKPLRASADDDLLGEAIDRAIGLKPKGHDFIIDRRAQPPERQPPHERHRRLKPVRLPTIRLRSISRNFRLPINCDFRLTARFSPLDWCAASCWLGWISRCACSRRGQDGRGTMGRTIVAIAPENEPGIDAFTEWTGKRLAWLILVAVIVSAVNAIIRKTFDTSSNSWLELQWVLFSIVFLLCSPWTLLDNEHIRIDIVNRCCRSGCATAST